MRLHFWACREEGMFERSPSFEVYYTKFLAHFVSVYERSAPPFARDSARWSLDPRNTEAYLANGRTMADAAELAGPHAAALARLPAAERGYSGSKEGNGNWPYC